MVFKKGDPTRLGTTHSDETRQKMSNSHKNRIALNGHNMTGIFPSEETKSRISNSLKGRVFSDEHKRKISEGLKLNPPNKGWDYDRWMLAFPKILISALKRSLEGENLSLNNNTWRKLRKAVYKRDKFICQECYCKCDDVSRIACHHIDFDRLNDSMDNLITLCASCHGKTTQKPEEWIQYYQDKMIMINNKTTNVAEKD